ncbi:MAG: hypothetical protein D6775_05530 [Caldilineae bacterium]|nr:MAG: hypothetical protein D6775_05530 [Caldilineae bacterium]
MGSTRVGDPAPFARDPAGRLYFFFIVGEAEPYHPRIVAVDARTESLWQREYPQIEIRRPDLPDIVWDRGQLRLFWLGQEQLYTAVVEPATGLMRDWPLLLSGEKKVGNYALAQGQDGRLHVWFAGTLRNPGLYALPPDAFGAEPLLVDPQGVRPGLALDAEGTLHAIWAHMRKGETYNPIFYAAYPQGEFRPGAEQEVARPLASTTSIVAGPFLGMDADFIYVLWSIEIRTGMSAGSVETGYVAFPRGRPGPAMQMQSVRVPAVHELPYRAVEDGGFVAGDRVVLAETRLPSTGQVTSLAPTRTTRPEMALAHRALVEYLMRKDEMQVSTLFFREGQPHSYQLISFTAGDSRSPYLLADEEGYLYLSWLERGDVAGFLVYVASTSPAARQHLARLSQEDVLRLGARTLFGLVSGMLLIPFALMWFAAPLLLVLLTAPLRAGREEWQNPRVLASLVISLAGYWVSKMVFLPGIREYVPFTAWIPVIPRGLYLPLQILTPLLIALFAIWVAKRFTFDRLRNSPLLFVLLYCTVDGLLTTAVYGVIIFATN